jgi:DNA mismatch repair protein MSH4
MPQPKRAAPGTPRTPRPGAADAGPSASAGPSSGGEPLSNAIVAIVENSRREVGIATCDLRASPAISLCQLSDDKFYTKSLSTLGRFDARMLLYCQGKDSNASGGLLRAIQRSEDCPLHVESLGRKYFDEARGLAVVREVSLKEDAAMVEKEVVPMYLALAAAAALVEYCRWKLNLLVQTAHAIKIQVVEVEGYMLLDGATIGNLEILANPRTGDTRRCLFGVLNRCRTRGGQRLLRASLRMPLCDLPSIRARQACVRALLSSQKAFEETAKMLPHFGDLDAMLRAVATLPATALGATPGAAAQSRTTARIRGLLQLKHVLTVAPELDAALGLVERGADGEPESAILRTCAEQLRRPAIGTLLALIDRVVSPEAGATPGGKASTSQPAALLSVVRDGIDPVLDHTRTVWEQAYADLHTLVEYYNEQFGSTAFALAHSARRGFHLTAAASLEGELPKSFIHCTKVSKRTLHVSTEQLEQINARMRTLSAEVLLLTDRVLEGLLAEVRAEMRLLYLVAESVSLVDMLLSLAELAASADGEYTCPDVTDGGPLVVRNGRHVLIEHIRAVDDLVPNSLYMSEASNLMVVTGANMSGKSTLLAQNMLLVILAQIGSLVPATFASVPIFSRLLSRLGSADCLESNASTFTVEMLEVAYITRALGAGDSGAPAPRALVVIDELGRGTSNSEGFAIAWATAEYLAGFARTYTLFATHFLQLDGLTRLYPNVRSYNMTVVQDLANRRFSMLHRLSEGSATHCDYLTGMLAETAGVPADVVGLARQITASLAVSALCSDASVVEHVQPVTQLLGEKVLNLRFSTLDNNALRRMLHELQQAQALELPASVSA